MGPVAGQLPPADGKTAEHRFRSTPRRLAVTVSAIGLVAAPVLTLGQTIRLQSPWADPSRRRRHSFIIDKEQTHEHEKQDERLHYSQHGVRYASLICCSWLYLGL